MGLRTVGLGGGEGVAALGPSAGPGLGAPELPPEEFAGRGGGYFSTDVRPVTRPDDSK